MGLGFALQAVCLCPVRRRSCATFPSSADSPRAGLAAGTAKGAGGFDWTAAQAAVQVLSAKWVIPVIAVLTSGARTHTEIYRAVGPGVSQKVLTETLRRMQDAGLLTREDRSSGPAGAYDLTQAGKTVLGPLEALAVWRIRANTDFSGGISAPAPGQRQSLGG